MKELNFTIGEALKLLNITEGTIRNYEKKGLITSKRQENNIYRRFTYKDLNRIETVRKYRNLGISLSDIKEILFSNTPEDTEKLLVKHKQSLLNEAKSLIEKADKLAFDIEKIRKIEKYLGSYDFVYRDEFCFYPFDEITKYKNIVKENLFDEYISVFSKDCLESNFIPVVGFSQKDKNKFDNGGKIYPKSKCLYTVVEVNPEHIGIKSFSDILYSPLTYISEKGYKVCDDIIAIKLLTLQKEDKQYDYYELYIPISK